MRARLLVALVAVAMLATAAQATGKEISKDFHQDFDVQEGVRVHVRHGDGDVTVTPWDRDVVDVEIHYRADVKSFGLGGKTDFDVEFRQTGDSIHIIGKTASSHVIGFYSRTTHEYTYTIRAPHYVELDLNGDDGDVDVEAWRSDIKCVLDDGDVTLRDIVTAEVTVSVGDGDVRAEGLEADLTVGGDDGDINLIDCRFPSCEIELGDGDVMAKRCEGEFDIDLDDGDVRLHQVRSSSVSIRADDGDIDIDLVGGGEVNVDVATADGSVALGLEQGVSAEFKITVDDGRISIDLPDATRLKEGRGKVSGQLGGGDGRIRIRTDDGDVTLSQEG